MKHFFIVAFLLLSVTFSVAAQVKLSDYTKPNDGQDDSQGFQRAIDEVASRGGGTISIPEGTWNLNSPVTFVNYEYVNNSFTIKGTKGSIIMPGLSRDGILFGAGNQNQLNFEDLIFVGDETKNFDFNTFLFATYVGQLRIIGCQFFGLRAKTTFLHVGNVDLIVRDTLFNGLSSGVAVIWAESFKGVSVYDTEFMDYGHLNGKYYSKSASGNPAWILLEGVPTVKTALEQRAVYLRNVRFDEGGYEQVIANNVIYLQAHGIQANVAPVSEATGFFLNNVKYCEITMSSFGYSNVAKPAVTAINYSTVFMDGISLGSEVYYGSRDRTSRAFFNSRNCPGCSFEQSDVNSRVDTTTQKEKVDTNLRKEKKEQ